MQRMSEPAVLTRQNTEVFDLGGLNDAQRRAVEAIDGPVLVLAGAGTGKTRVLTTRLAFTIATGRAFPSELLAVTFTNKAAREMRERLGAMIGRAAEGVWLGTFHAIAARILRRHAEAIGLKPSFTILDTDDQIRLLKQILQAENMDERRWPARLLLAQIQRWKDRGLGPEKVSPADAGGFAQGRAVDLYRQYQERLMTVNAVDFGDLILHNLSLFTGNPDILVDYQRRFRYLLVDEYQDTNVAQYLWLRLLAQNRRNLCCVGDDDQSIYSWRGAEIGNILRFEKDFPGSTIARLEQNYRSTPHILGAAGSMIAQIEALQRKRHALSEIAILVRAGFQTREFEDRFITLALPYRVIGGPRFYERQEIRDALAYLRLLNQPADDLAFERILNTPRRGIGSATVQELHGFARAERLPLIEAARMLIAGDRMRPAARNALAAFVSAVDGWRARAQHISHTDLVQIVLDESGYTAMWQADRSPDAAGRLENLKELVVAMAEFENLGGFLEHVSLVMDNAAEAGGDMVNLMTLHSAKGLEFDSVFLPGWEEGLFPNQRAMEENGLAALEEERRLAYVGLTRARHRAYVSFAANRRIHGQWQNTIRSRFVDELPNEHVEIVAELGLQPAASWDAGWTSAIEVPPAAPWRPAAAPRRPLLANTGLANAGPVPRRGEELRRVGGFAVGGRVFHQKFGYGTITAVEGNKLAIHFDVAGDKKIMDAFVEHA
jgi:DNA helicase-2/ATP-dependent DNA helicase PcrA